MSDHKKIGQWLQAYYDGEIKGRQLTQVEAHLAECPSCQTALEELSALSTVLHSSPAAATLTRPAQFNAQVMMQLPRRQLVPFWHGALKAGFQLMPLGLILVWIFRRTTLLLTSLLSGIELLAPGSPRAAELLSGVTRGAQSQLPFELPELGMSAFLNSLWQTLGLGSYVTIDWGYALLLPAVLGILYLSWLAGWWIAQNGSPKLKM